MSLCFVEILPPSVLLPRNSSQPWACPLLVPVVAPVFSGHFCPVMALPTSLALHPSHFFFSLEMKLIFFQENTRMCWCHLPVTAIHSLSPGKLWGINCGYGISCWHWQLGLTETLRIIQFQPLCHGQHHLPIHYPCLKTRLHHVWNRNSHQDSENKQTNKQINTKTTLLLSVFIKTLLCRMGNKREVFQCPFGHSQAGAMSQLGNQALPSWSGWVLQENTCSLFQG